MSMGVIDSQMMITRSADFVKESSAIQKQAELAQDHVAVKVRENVTEEQQKVPEAKEGEMISLRPDGNNSGDGGAAYSGKRQSKTDDDDELSIGNIVPPSNHIIDIKI